MIISWNRSSLVGHLLKQDCLTASIKRNCTNKTQHTYFNASFLISTPLTCFLFGNLSSLYNVYSLLFKFLSVCLSIINLYIGYHAETFQSCLFICFVRLFVIQIHSLTHAEYSFYHIYMFCINPFELLPLCCEWPFHFSFNSWIVFYYVTVLHIFMQSVDETFVSIFLLL